MELCGLRGRTCALARGCEPVRPHGHDGVPGGADRALLFLVVEHIGSAHDDAEPVALKEVAGQRLSPGPFVRLSGATRSINRDPGETGPDPGRLEGTCRGLSDPDPERSSAPTTACAASRSPLRMSKSDLRVRPIYHHLRQSIEVHPTSPKPSTTSTTTLNEPSRARRALRVAAPVAPTDRTVLRRKERHGGPPGQEDAQGLD